MPTQTVDVTEDTMAVGGNGSNYATSVAVTFGKSGTTNYYTFFKIPSATLGSGESVTSTTLRLTSYSAKPAGTVVIYTPNSAWSAATLNGNNMPSLTSVGTASVPALVAGQVFDIDISGYDLTHGVALHRNNADFYSVHSADATTTTLRPVVVYETVVNEPNPPHEVLSGPANNLALSGLQGATVALGDAVTPPVEVLSGLANSLSLVTLQGPLIAKGAAVQAKEVTSGLTSVLSLSGLGINAPTLTEPEPVGSLGEWFIEVVMAAKSLNARNPTASLEIRNDTKRVRTELKTLVRA